MKPMLAWPVAVEKLTDFCLDPKIMTEQKVDGHRKLITVDDGTVSVVGRDGQVTDLWAAAEFQRIKGHFVFDGEQLPGGRCVLYDLVEAGTRVNHRSPAGFRRDVLDGLFKQWNPGEAVQLLPCARTPEEKLLMVKTLISRRAEGVILRHVDGRYQPGVRSNRLMKAKFVKDIDCEVTDLCRGGKANIVVVVYTPAGRKIEFECTALSGDKDLIQVGDVVTIRYLYAVDPAKPDLVQPTFPKIRTRWITEAEAHVLNVNGMPLKPGPNGTVGDPRFPNDKGGWECLDDQLVYTDKTVWPDLVASL